MIRNYLKIAWRNLLHDKSFSALNILSLTIGLTFSLLLFYYIQDELSFDKYHEKADRIYRVTSTLIEPDKTDEVAISPIIMGTVLRNDYPDEVEQSVRYIPARQTTLLKYQGQEAYIEKIFYADSNSFEVFTHPFIAGDPRTALNEPNSLVLTRSTALKFFAKPENALNQSLNGEGNDVYKITGVIEDVPANSHVLFNALFSMNTNSRFNNPNQWGNFGAMTYVLLKPSANPDSFESKLSSIYPTYQKSIFEPFGVTMTYLVQPITDIHLKSTLKYEPEPLGNISFIYTFSAVAFLLLLIACINYMNLTTARSARRAREIGIRKVSGSVQGQLVAQFLVESMLLALIAFGLSLIAITALLPTFNSISGKHFTIPSLLQPVTLLSTLAIVLIAGFVGGSYPAFVLSRFNPLVVLKGKLAKASSNAGLRKSLVVVQFTVSIAMLISTWIIYDQLNFLENKDLGYNKENVLVVNLPFVEARTLSSLEFMKKQALNNPNVKRASTSYYTPGSSGQNYNLFEVETEDGFVSQGIDNFGIDENYLENFDIRLAQGRNFRLTDRPDSCINVLVNEAFVKKMNWGDNALGKRIKNQGNEQEPFLYVIGVVKDFHMRSVYNPIEPLMLTYTHDNGSIQFRISDENIAGTIASIEKIYKQKFPDEPMEYTFADEDFMAQFESDQTRGTLFSTFSGLTIVLAFLGLLGLIAYTTQQRKKEIAVRKIMGANSSQIVVLMAKNYLLLVGIASLLAFPISWYFMSDWLDSFVFKTSMNPFIFGAAALIILSLTLVTVAFHSIKAAVGNQVEAMRIE